MAYKHVALAIGMIAAAPLSATVHDQPVPAGYGAPASTPETKYCMRIEALTGTRIEEVKCWTRQEWADHEVDVHVDWAKEGVRTIG